MNLTTAGERYVQSDEYRRALERRTPDAMVAALRDAGEIPLLSNAETRAALKLRTFSNLYPFSIDGTAYAGELPVATNVPQLVETVETTKDQVELGYEVSESVLATAVAVGQPLPEGQINTGASAPTLQTLPRFGVALPVTMSVLDDPGQMASFINRRISGGFMLGLENDIINGNNYWTGAMAAATNTTSKGGSARVVAIITAAGQVQALGFYEQPISVVANPTTKATILSEESATSGDPLLAHEMLRDFLEYPPAKLIYPSKFVPVDQALVGDFFSAITLFTKGDLTISFSRVYQDFLARDMVEFKLVWRCYSWVRQGGALSKVTGIT